MHDWLDGCVGGYGWTAGGWTGSMSVGESSGCVASGEGISCRLLELETDSVLWVMSTTYTHRISCRPWPLLVLPPTELPASPGEGTGRHDSL